MADNNENKVLNVPHLRFPEFTEEWEETTLGKISEITKGSGISKDQLSEQGSPCILYGELYTKYKSEIIDEVYSRTELDSSSLVKSKANDVIIPCSGETAIDISTARCVPFNNILLGGDLNIIRLKHDDGGFFAYQLNGARKKDIARVAQGVSVVHLYGENLKHIRVYHPAIEEQKKITRLLSLIDERIATQNKIIEKLQSLIKGLVDELMTVLLKGKLYPFSSFYIKAGEGGTPTTSVVEYYTEGTIPFIKIEDLSCKYLTNNKDFITELGMQKSSAWLIPSKSVIYSNGATIGAISINEYPVCTKQGILGIVPNTNINVEYLYLLMSSSYFSKEISRIITEGTMKTAYLKDINHIKCPLPSMAQQKNITNLTSSIEEKLSIEQELLRFLNLQKQYLLHMMFI
ncbi:restriction endonuclease subunit S [Bacteroides fragilis]|uniref:restriction endonuclease subunit S n=3 Tax=Bacteroidia TaxID=200643 RepID=UPI0022AA82C7|nr:restriction endonuclease subunit S [Bacteroides fragilis]MCZ2694688.1 restriction endonuclease subunit S [Bacteroides fragilis]